MVLKGILPYNEEELITPPIEVPGVEVEDHRDEVADVLDHDRLGVQVCDCSSLMKEQVEMQIIGVMVVGGVVGECVLIVRIRRSLSGRALLLSARKGIAGVGGHGIMLFGGGFGFLLGLSSVRKGSLGLGLGVGGEAGGRGVARGSEGLALGGGCGGGGG
jgi:hypothetical protein